MFRICSKYVSFLPQKLNSDPSNLRNFSSTCSEMHKTLPPRAPQRFRCKTIVNVQRWIRQNAWEEATNTHTGLVYYQ